MRTAVLADGAYDIGMFRFHWDKATTRVASATEREDLADGRVQLSHLADATLRAAEELGRRSRRPPVVESDGAPARDLPAAGVDAGESA